MKNVLLVSYFCPPDRSIGSLRASKMLKYLPQFGYQPYLLGGMPGEDSDPYVLKPRYYDPFQSARKSRNTIREYLAKRSISGNNGSIRKSDNARIHESPRGLLPLSEVRMPDKFLFWILPAIKFGRQLLDNKEFHIIYSSSGPASSAIIASILHRYSNIPWVAEFRDLWSENHIDVRKKSISKIDSYIENRTLRNCSALVTVSEPLREKLVKRHGKDTYVIYNGYDEEDYAKNLTLTKKFTITYTGMIYPGKRDPTPLFQAISNLDKSKKLSPDILQVRFYGPSQEEMIQPLAKYYGIERYLYLGGVISYNESLLRQSESWLLLLLEWNNPLAKGVLTGKFFEYLGAGRPILSTGPEGGSIEEKLLETGAGVLLNDPENIKKFLLSCISKYEEGDARLGFAIKDEKVAIYSRKNAAREISNIFSSLL